MPLPEPLLRDALGTWTAFAPKSPLTVLRIALMGAGQLGATTAMLRAARREQSSEWASFWFTLSIVAGLKAAIETLQFALLGVGLPPSAQPAFYAAALVPVIGGVGWALHRLWRSRAGLKAVRLRASEIALLGASLALWLSAAAVAFGQP